MRNKREKFVTLAERRVNKTVHSLRLIGNLANRSAYEFGEADIKKMFRALQKELDSARARFGGDAGGKDNEFTLD